MGVYIPRQLSTINTIPAVHIATKQSFLVLAGAPLYTPHSGHKILIEFGAPTRHLQLVAANFYVVLI